MGGAWLALIQVPPCPASHWGCVLA
eukprot:COSAG01_NODE_22217_length_866_cov_1.413299_2_plen_24_part_01